MTAPENRFQPDPSSIVKPPPSLVSPESLQEAPAVQQAGTSKEPKDAFQDPAAEKFMVEFWSGIGSKKLVMAAPNKESAILAAYFVATQHFPDIHTFGVWKKDGEEIRECVCFVALANILPFCSKELAELTGKKILTPAVPVVTAEAGFEELKKQLKTQGGVRKT